MNQLLVTISVIACVASCILAYPTHHDDEHHHGGSYKFDYSVHDAHTGDFKQQHEVRHGDSVKGSYSFAEPDGTYRIVEYEADPHKGFNAVVKRTGKAHHPQVHHHHEEPHHHEEHHHEELHHDEHHHDQHEDEHHHDEHSHDFGGDLGEAKSHVGATHWGHH